MKITYYGNVAAKREAEYPPVQTQLEMIWRALSELQSGGPMSGDVGDMIAMIRAVQEKYPNP